MVLGRTGEETASFSGSTYVAVDLDHTCLSINLKSPVTFHNQRGFKVSQLSMHAK